MFKKYIIIILAIILLIVSVVCGFLIRSFTNFSKEQEGNQAILAEEQNEKIVGTSYSDIKISPNAQVQTTQTFNKCGHTTTNNNIVPRDIVNLSKEEVEEYYTNQGYNIEELTSEKICLSRKTQGICEQHYILRESDGYISISCKNDIGEYIFKGLTDISVQYLAEEDLMELQKGIEVIGKDNLNKFLEDFE